MKLCLGTVQLGMDYGINNKIGQPNSKNCFNIIDYAINNGIYAIDTAYAYGTAEYIIGEYLKTHTISRDIKIISKLDPNLLRNINSQSIIAEIYTQAKRSLKILNIDCYDGFMLHNPNHLYNKQIINGLLQLKAEGLTKHTGVSIYNIEDGFVAIDQGLDYVQLPVNVFDQRGIHSGFLKKAQTYNVKTFARSAFLQGLFFMDKLEALKIIPESIPLLNRFDQLLNKYNLLKINALIGFIKSIDLIDYFIFGAEKKSQIESNINIFKNVIVPDNFVNELLELFNPVEIKIISPNLWDVSIQEQRGKKMKKSNDWNVDEMRGGGGVKD